MSQNIINPDRRDPSKIRNKADIGLSRVDNVGVSDILDITKDLVKDEVCKGDRYAEQELKAGVAFEIPLCEFTENSTKLSVTISFLKDDEIKYSITAHVFHTYDTPQSGEPFRIKFDSVGNLILSSTNPISFYLYKGKNDQDFLSLRCDSTLNISYEITSISYYFSDYIVVSNEKEDYIGFKRLTDQSILTGKNVGTLLPQNSRSDRYEYKPSEGDRSKASVASSLPVYDSLDKLVYDESLNPSSSSGYKFPTINEVPFTGSENIKVNNNSTRNITISAKHSGPSQKDAGDHNWEVLTDTRVLIENPNISSGFSVKSLSTRDAENEGYGLCKMVGESIFSQNNSGNAIGELNDILNNLNTTTNGGYNDSSVSFGLLQKYLKSICTILKNVIGSSGEVSIEFGEKIENNNIENQYTYFGISPTIGKTIQVHYKLTCPEKCCVSGIIMPSSKGNYLVDISSIIGDLGESAAPTIDGDKKKVIFYNGLESEVEEGKVTISGVIEFTTTQFPSFETNLSLGEENYFKIFFTTSSEDDQSLLLTYPIHLKSLNTNCIFYENSSATSIFNPIILSRLCKCSISDTTNDFSLTTLKKYSENFLDGECSKNYESAKCIWKNVNVDIDPNKSPKSIVEYGVILPPKNFMVREEDGVEIKDYLLVEGYSLSKYVKLEFISPEKGKTLGDFFEDFKILIKSYDDSSSNYQIIPKNIDNFLKDDNPSITFKLPTSSQVEKHKYNNLTAEDLIEKDPGFSEEIDNDSFKYSEYRFYLLFSPKSSTHEKSYFDLIDLSKNPYIRIISCRSENSEEEISGNEIKIKFSQIKSPIVIKSANVSNTEKTYGVYSSLKFRKDEKKNPHGTAYFEEDSEFIAREELKFPITLYETGYNNGKLLGKFTKSNLPLTSNNFSLLSINDSRVQSRTPSSEDIFMYENFIKIISSDIKYSHIKEKTKFSHYNFITEFKLPKKDLNKIYNSLNKDIWVGNSKDNYPQDFLPDSEKTSEVKYQLNKTSNYIADAVSIGRRKNIIFSLQGMAVTNYCPIIGDGAGNGDYPAIFINFRKDTKLGYTKDNMKFPENVYGTEHYYKVDCSDRTWGGGYSSDKDENGVIRRLSNLLVSFGFGFNIAGNFSGKVSILANLKVTAPRINTTSSDSDYLRFLAYEEKYSGKGFSYYTWDGYKTDLSRLKNYVDNAFFGKEEYSWEMYTTVDVNLDEKFKSALSYLGNDLKDDQYTSLQTGRKYTELPNANNRLVFYPQNQKDFENETNPWEKAKKTKYSILNLNVNCRYKDPSTNLTDEIVWKPGYENTNPFNNAHFPQSSALFPDNDIWDNLVNIYPRMTAMKPVYSPTTLELTLEFYQDINNEKIPIDVNNGIDNNKLTFKFDLWPQGHKGNPDDDNYGKLTD